MQLSGTLKCVLYERSKRLFIKRIKADESGSFSEPVSGMAAPWNRSERVCRVMSSPGHVYGKIKRRCWGASEVAADRDSEESAVILFGACLS